MATPFLLREMPETIGPFRLVKMLGEGAMGTVYLGERVEMFQQQVAIKVLRPQTALVGGAAAMEREEKILTSLDHPAIVRLLDKGEQAGGLRYIVMEYVEGVNLALWVAESKPDRVARLRMLVEVLQAVDYAHRRLVIHADLKPENIFVTSEGRPKLLDFGIATLVDSAEAGEGFTRVYASPEQLAGARVTPASDIYSMGVVGGLLGDGAEFKAITDRATRPEPEERYRSAGEFAADVEALLENRPVSARRGNRAYRVRKWMQRNRTVAAVVVVVLLVLAGSVAGVVVETARAARERQATENRLRDLVRLTGVLDGELYASVAGLPRAEAARATLLQGAKGTLDKLAADGTKDAVLAVEMAKQYEQLARVEMGAGDVVGARKDLEQGRKVLEGVRGEAVIEERARVEALRSGLGR